MLWICEKNIYFYNMSNYIRTKSVVPHLHRQQIFLKSVQSAKCKLFTMFNLACRHFNLYFPHSLQSNSLQQHTKMFSKIMFIIRRLYFSTESGWVDLATSNIFLSVFTVASVVSRIFMLINRILASWQIRFALTTSILKENSLHFLHL